jgi:uncharacterized membrane protein
MIKKIFKSTCKLFLVCLLALTLVLGSSDHAFAARGGRMGGGSFRRTPSRSYSAPSRSYGAPSRSYSPSPARGPAFGGGFGFNPFFFMPFPMYGFGGSSLLSLLVLAAVASFLVRSFRQAADGGINLGEKFNRNPKVSVAKLQVGLSAQARLLQSDLDRIALTSDTDTNEGLAGILQETTIALLRTPEYWTYGITESQETRLNEAESQFNRFLLEERSKLTGESLSNVKGQLQQKANDASATLTPTDGEPAMEYIVVTILVGTEGKLQLPTINDSDDLRQAIRQIGAVPSDQLMALEIIWSPQNKEESLTEGDLLAQYPNLKLV